MVTTKRDAKGVASLPALDNEHLMMVTDGGKLIRMPIRQIKKAGRNTIGVILFRLDKDEKVVSVTCVDEYDEDEDLEAQTTEAETQAVETQVVEEGQEPSLETQEPSENETETETVEE